VRHRAKLCANLSNRCGDIAIFRFFKMAAVCHLGFLKVGNFKCRTSSCRLVKPLLRYSDFWIFQDGEGRHLGFLELQILMVKRVKSQTASQCQILWQSVKTLPGYRDF